MIQQVQKPRVLALMGGTVLYGQERGNIEALAALRDGGCEVLCLVQDEDWAVTIRNALDLRYLDWRRVPYVGRRNPGYLGHFLFKNPLLLLRAHAAMFSLMFSFRPTHIHVPNPYYFLNFIAVLLFFRGPAIVYRLGDKPLRHNIFWRLLWKLILKRVDRFVAVSHFVAEKLTKSKVPHDAISVIYNRPPARKHAPRPHVTPESDLHVLFIGQITPQKGVDLLVEAFDLALQQHPDARLSIVGRINEDDILDRWAQDLRGRVAADERLRDSVSFVGEVEDIYSQLAGAAFVVTPSVCEEALGNVVLESKAAARPSVVFPRGGLPELVEHTKDGFVCREPTRECLVEALLYYLDEPRRAKEHGLAALTSLEHLGTQDFGRNWLRAYERAAERRTDSRP